MEEKIIRKYTLWIVGACFFICCSLIYLPQVTVYANSLIREYRLLREEARKREEMPALELLKFHQEEIQPEEKEEIGRAIRIPMADRGKIGDIEIENDYMSKKITFFFPNTKEEILNKDPIVGNPAHIEAMQVWEKDKGLYIEMKTDQVIEPVFENRDDGFCYLTLENPKDVFEKIIVVDAGHGGKMPGAVKGDLREKNINLEIVKQIKKVFDKDDKIKVYYTRLDDAHVELWDRVGLANELEADLFVSIHQNTLGTTDNSTSGAQVLYSESAKGKKNSKAFAQILMDELMDATKCKNRGVVAGDRIYIVREAKMPVALVEVGFLSNTKERALLQDTKYQKKVAKGIYQGVMAAIKKGF